LGLGARIKTSACAQQMRAPRRWLAGKRKVEPKSAAFGARRAHLFGGERL
jgi:hypothetical protein